MVMFPRLLIPLYAVVSYALFVASFGYSVAFIGDYFVPRTIDRGPASPAAEAAVTDLLLIGLFALQHSVMARPAFKRWCAGIVPAACQRSTYVLFSSLALVLLFWQWRPIAAPVWQLDGIAADLMTGLFWSGWAIALASTYMIDHFDLFGLRQALAALRRASPAQQVFKTPLFYKIVRHPLMFGLLLAFWAAPVMTAGHLLFAAAMTVYVVGGVHLEERDLIAEFGASYQTYRRRVPMLLPRLWPRGHADNKARESGNALRN